MPTANILVVDDEPDVTYTVKKGLERAGFHVTSFTNPIEALQSFTKGKFDLVISDVKMPQMDGFTLFEKLRQIDSALKVCFLTAFEVKYEDEFRKRFPALDIRCYMKKPVAISAIIESVNAELAVA